MFLDEDLLPISALQHLLFCERQCALIHLERVWVENRLTVEGRHLHAKAHDSPSQWQGRVRVTRGLLLRNYRFGLLGKADIVEFEPPADVAPPEKWSPLKWGDWQGWRITPIEYKRGQPKSNDCDRVQLCAQALCLEEMLAVDIGAGAIFYGKRRRRTLIQFDGALRAKTIAMATRLHEMIASGRTPLAVREPKCDRCSLIDICLPAIGSHSRGTDRYFERAVRMHLAAAGPTTDVDCTDRP